MRWKGFDSIFARGASRLALSVTAANPVMNITRVRGLISAQRCAEMSPRTRVMFITGFAAVTLKASREAPRAKMLSKPFHLKDLVLEVERIFEDELTEAQFRP